MKINETIRAQFSPEIYVKACLLYIKSNAQLIGEIKISTGVEKQRLLHKLKGGAKMLGFIEMSQLLSEAEEQPNKDFSAKIETLFIEIKEFCK